MADYIYLLQTRLSFAQQRAIGTIRAVARASDVTLFLTGGAVRDLTGGGSVRDLDFTIQGDVSRLRPGLEEAGAAVYGENIDARQIFFVFPGGVRVELSSARSVTYPKPGLPVYEPGNLSDDLRSRDFTANAMAISLNDGSYGLLIDPLNGVADIENRELRLVSNYGFIEEPSRLIRAARLSSRLGWHMEERTRQRYDTAKEEGYISALSPWYRGYELEEIFHEEDPVRILRALEAEQWMKILFPALDAAKANTAALAELAERQGHLQTQGMLAHSAALAFPLVTAKLSPTEVANLKSMFVRSGFVHEMETLDARTREFATRFASKEAATPSAAWKMLHDAEPNLVLSLAHTTKTASVQSRLKTFLTDSPGARQRIPYTLLQEMRITSDLPGYAELLDKLFFELMDGRLSTTEEMKAYLEPYSPPAPPPPVNLRRAKAKKEVRPSRAKGKKTAEVDETPDISHTKLPGTEQELLTASAAPDGIDTGTEPATHTELEGKVAPLAAAVRESAPIKAKSKKAPVVVDETAVADDELVKAAPDSRGSKSVAAAEAPTKKVAAKSEKPATPVRQIITIPPDRAAPRSKETKSAIPAVAKKAAAKMPESRPKAARSAVKKASGSAAKLPAKVLLSAKKAAPAVPKKVVPPVKAPLKTAPLKAAAKAPVKGAAAKGPAAKKASGKR